MMQQFEQRTAEAMLSPNSAEHVVELDRVDIRLGGRVIQEDMTFSLYEGEFIAVLGPNGAGKSTLFRLLLGLLRPSSGSVRVLGHPPKRGNRAIGYVPQFRVLETSTALRGRDVVGFGLDGHRWGPGWPSRRREAAVDRALDEVDARDLANAGIDELSGGERQRLLIAQALLTNPRLLLLDEPLANLDMSRAQEIVALADGLRRSRKVTIVLVTHDVNPLLRVVDRVVYLAGGRSAIGAPGEVITASTLSALYGTPVEVVKALGKMFVVGAEV